MYLTKITVEFDDRCDWFYMTTIGAFAAEAIYNLQAGLDCRASSSVVWMDTAEPFDGCRLYPQSSNGRVIGSVGGENVEG